MSTGSRGARMPLTGVLGLPALLVLAACGSAATRAAVTLAPPQASAQPAAPAPAPVASVPTLLINQNQPFAERDVRRLRGLSGVGRVALIGYGQVWVYGRPVPTAGIDPATYRGFTPVGTRDAVAVWQAVMDGKAVVSHVMGERDHLPLDALVPAGSATIRIAGLATTVPGVDMVVSAMTGQRLGVPFGNGLVVAGSGDPEALSARIRRALGPTPVIRRIASAGGALGAPAAPLLPSVTPSVPPATPLPTRPTRPTAVPPAGPGAPGAQG
jgi:hypothetical protein